MNEIEYFINQHEDHQIEIMFYFHNFLSQDLNLEGKMRFDIPFYFGKSWICYLNPIDDSKVEFAFVRGNELSNEQGLLSNKGRKQVYSIDFTQLSEIPTELLNEVIQEAILLDETKPYESKHKNRK